ncbi:MAG TPA: hypothetical protein VIH57_26375 [Bacteroidales bacterium]
MPKIVLCCFFLLTGLSAKPQAAMEQHHEIKNYITNNISIENQNWNISQSPLNGMIYFANSEGLVEYNGISKKIYHLPHRKGVRSVLADNHGNIFTGSFEDFGYWKLDENGQLTYHSLTKDFTIEKNDEIWKIYTDGGKVYFQSFTTIYSYDYKHVTPIKSPFTMLFMFQVGKRFVVQVLDNGLYWFDGEKFDFIPGSEMFVSRKVHAVIQSSPTEMLICTANQGIYKFSDQKFTYFHSPISSFLEVYTCNAGLMLNDSLIVYGTILNGVVFTNTKGQILRHYNFSNGLNNNTVLSLTKDMDNGLWVGLDEGVNHIDIASPYTYYINSNGTLGTIYTVLKDNDRLYMGTNHGLFVADIVKTSGNYEFTNIKLIPNSQGQVWTLEKFDNQIICGHNEGTYLVEGNSLRQISNVTGGWTIKQYNDFLIEGTYTGIVIFQKDKQGKWTFRNKVKYFGEPTRHLEIDYLGYIWTLHPPKGIYRLELNETLDSVVKTDFYNIVMNKPLRSDVVKIKNKIAFITTENIYTYDYDQKKIIPFNSLNTSLGSYAHASNIIHFEKDKYWFVNGHKIGLFEIAKDFSTKKYFELLQKSIDIPERDIQIIGLDDKTLLIPNRQAFSTYGLTAGEKDNNISRLQIKDLLFQGKAKGLEFSPELTRTFEVPYRNNNLTVNFADPSHFNREEKEFFYKIEELDEAWHVTTLDNFTYLNLKYGTYHLLIKSDASDHVAEVKFVILRPWYLTWPSFGLYLLILAGLVMLGVKIFNAELRKQKQLIEFEVRSKKLESELDYKSYELMLSMRYLIQKNEILTELQKQIEDIRNNSSKYPIKPMRDMEKILDEGLKQQTEEWRSAMDNLKLSQQGFFKKLKDKHPELTPHDLRLCSYLRMNFTTKEIAKLLNITTRGVEISRYRLRRKMGLDHDKNLTEYLIGQTFEE